MQNTILKPNKRQDPSEVNGQKPKPSEATWSQSQKPKAKGQSEAKTKAQKPKAKWSTANNNEKLPRIERKNWKKIKKNIPSNLKQLEGQTWNLGSELPPKGLPEEPPPNSPPDAAP